MAGTEAATDLGMSSRRSQEHDDEIVEVALDVQRDLLATEDVRAVDERSGNLMSKLTQVTNGLKEAHELEEEGATGTIGKEHLEEVGQKPVAVALKGLQLVTATVGHADWSAVEQRFNQIQVDGMLPSSKFGECIWMEEGSESDEFSVQVFDSLSRKRGMVPQALTKDELKDFWEQLSDQCTIFTITEGDPYLKNNQANPLVFKDADGRITLGEVKEIIAFGASANKPPILEELADEYTTLIMEELDPDNLRYIKLEDLKALLLQSSSRAAARSTTHSLELSKAPSMKPASNKDTSNWQKFTYFLEENWQRIWFIQYRNRAVFHIMGYCVSTAKGGAEILKFNMALVLLPVCRNTITLIRSKTKIGAAVPFNDNINFHNIIAVGVAVGVGLHAGPHLTSFLWRQKTVKFWWFVKGTEGWTGVVMVLLMTIAFVLAHPWFRRNKLDDSNPLKKMTGFDTFWFTHHLFVIVYALLIVHGVSLFLSRKWYKKTTWMYLAVPGLLYVSERILRLYRSHNAVRIKKVPNILSLRLGNVFINCPAVARFEWHPFSFTSALGDRSVSVHIRTKADWTKRLKDDFVKNCRPPIDGKSGLLRADFSKGKSNASCPKLFMDGPYDAPAQDYQEYDVVLLIGLGIGATPLISIIKDVLNQIKRGRSVAKAKKRPFMTKKAYLYWATRETGSFQWFRRVMDKVAKKGKMDTVYEGDVTFSRASIKMHFGRPEWPDVFKHVAENHENQRIGVFYCGEPRPMTEIRNLSTDFNQKTNTKFEFHKENF
uniref:FAD-binding FR-type domain-containing protein n=1 Tax=Setaria italica TaxID=4555 RepID=K3YLF5_SETIT